MIVRYITTAQNCKRRTISIQFPAADFAIQWDAMINPQISQRRYTLLDTNWKTIVPHFRCAMQKLHFTNIWALTNRSNFKTGKHSNKLHSWCLTWWRDHLIECAGNYCIIGDGSYTNIEFTMLFAACLIFCSASSRRYFTRLQLCVWFSRIFSSLFWHSVNCI